MKRMAKFVWTAWIFVICFSFSASATTYYVDAENGRDRISGQSPAKAWQTLLRVNATEFSPGDRILLRAGGRWSGSLHAQGSGTADLPIVIDRYGDGEDPVIDGKGLEGQGVINLHNQSYWEISHLEITNDAPEAGDRRGVTVSAANAGIVRHIHLWPFSYLFA